MQHVLADGLATQPLRRITFVPAKQPDAQSACLTSRLQPLSNTSKGGSSSLSTRTTIDESVISGPQSKELFKETAVKLKWTRVCRVGCGLENLGNTCFMNSVLQCLTHTPPLAELAMSGKELGPGTAQDPISCLQHHILKALQGKSPTLRPVHHANSLRLVNKRFRLGHQEDAHEYLRGLLDLMHESCLKPFKPSVSPELAYTTLVYRIFGGKLRSQIQCEGVAYESSTYDPFLDLSLEVTRSHSITRALEHFTAPEVLDGANRYRCPKNNKLMRATKRITIEEAPNVLTIQLKRFQFGGRGSKVSKMVEYPMELDLSNYMSNPGTRTHLYDLFAVLVHHGSSLNGGHYTCFVKASNGVWHLCDDARVKPVSQRLVEEQQAYILFYIRKQPRYTPAVEKAPRQRIGEKSADLIKAYQAPEAVPTHPNVSTQIATNSSLATQIATTLPAAQGQHKPGVNPMAVPRSQSLQHLNCHALDPVTSLKSGSNSQKSSSTGIVGVKRRDQEGEVVGDEIPGKVPRADGPRATGGLVQRVKENAGCGPPPEEHMVYTSSTESTAGQPDGPTEALARRESSPKGVESPLVPGGDLKVEPRKRPRVMPDDLIWGHKSSYVRHVLLFGRLVFHRYKSARRRLPNMSASGLNPGILAAPVQEEPVRSCFKDELRTPVVAGAGAKIDASQDTTGAPVIAQQGEEEGTRIRKKAREGQAAGNTHSGGDEEHKGPGDGPEQGSVLPLALASSRCFVKEVETLRKETPTQKDVISSAVGEEALALLAGTPLNKVLVNPWEDTEVKVVKQVAKMMRREKVSKHRYDDLDEEYDMGKVKKVRNKADGGGGVLSEGNAFQKAWNEGRRGGGRGVQEQKLRGRGGGRGGRISSRGRGGGKGGGRGGPNRGWTSGRGGGGRGGRRGSRGGRGRGWGGRQN